MSLSHIVEANGPVFTVVFLGLSFAMVFLIVLRWIKNRRAHTDVEKFVQQVEQELETGGAAGAIEFCERESVANQRVVATLFLTALREAPRGTVAARDAIDDCLDTKIRPALMSWLPSIQMIIKIAPMAGLLGTVWGMIGAFETIAGATKVNPSDLANDIGMALFTTAEGLIIAIPLIAANSVFMSRLQRFEVDLMRARQEALRLLGKATGRRSG